MSAGSDFFDDLRRALTARPGDAPALAIETDLRQRWQGARIYVAGLDQSDSILARVTAGLAHGTAAEATFARLAFREVRALGYCVERAP